MPTKGLTGFKPFGMCGSFVTIKVDGTRCLGAPFAGDGTNSVARCNSGQTRHHRKVKCALAVDQRSTVAVFFESDDCHRGEVRAIRL